MDEDDLRHLVVSPTRTGEALSLLQKYLAHSGQTLPGALNASATTRGRSKVIPTVAPSARAWLATVQKTSSVLNNQVLFNSQLRRSYAEIVQEEDLRRCRIYAGMRGKGDLSSCQLMDEPHSRMIISIDESASRNSLRSSMRASVGSIPLMEASNVLISALKAEIKEMDTAFSNTLHAIMLGAQYEKVDIINNLARQGRQAYYPAVQHHHRPPPPVGPPLVTSYPHPSFQPSYHQQHAVSPYYQQHQQRIVHQQLSKYTTNNHTSQVNHQHYSQLQQPQQQQHQRHPMAVQPHTYQHQHQQQQQPPPVFVSGGSGRYNPNSPQHSSQPGHPPPPAHPPSVPQTASQQSHHHHASHHHRQLPPPLSQPPSNYNRQFPSSSPCTSTTNRVVHL